MSVAGRLAVRAARLPGLGAGLNNTISQQTSAGRGGVRAATRNVSYHAPGQPMQSYDSPRGVYQYFASVWVMRCVRTIAQTIAGLPFRAGMDMDTPSNFVPDAPLARLLGPATTQAPGGPNPFTSSRDLWTWTIVQYVLTGKIGWELQTDGLGSKGNVAALWPLVSEFLNPIPTEGTSQFFSGFEYVVGGGERIRLSTDQVFYAWRPSARDWRKPESVLDSAKDVVGVQVALDRYYANLLKNNLFSPVIVKTPPFEEPEEERAFQESFTQQFTGFDNAGQPIFTTYEPDDQRPGQGKDTGDIQVERLTQTSTDAGLQEIAQQAKIDVTVALGVPESLIGNASQRTYANADAELRNAWTITFLPLILELQDKINVGLAPRIGKEVGWWDVSDVAALQPPAVIAQPSIPDLVQNGVATPAQIADLLDLPGSADQGETANEASAMSGAAEAPALSLLKIAGGVAGGGRADSMALEVRSKVAELRGARKERERRQVNEFAPTGPGPNVPIGNNYDPSNSGMLAPVGEKHAFKGRNLMACATCGQPRSSPIHTRPERRHAGKPGHQHVVGGHARSARRVDAEKAAWLTDVNAAEGPLTDALKGLFADQRKATISRLTGKRGRQMLKALERRQNEPPNTTAASQPPAAVTSGTVFTVPYWYDKTTSVVLPTLGAIGTQAASRVRRQVGAPAVNDQGTLATMQAALAARAQRLAQFMTETTANQITQALSEGVSNGEGIDALTARVNKVFDNADRNRAALIARTEVVGAANQAAHDYASNLPPGIVGKKRWVSHHDTRVRPSHLETDGQEVPVNAHYAVGVGRHPAMYPGDPTLPPGESINCRCGQMFLPGEASSATGVAS